MCVHEEIFRYAKCIMWFMRAVKEKKTHTEIIKRPFSSHCLKTLHSILLIESERLDRER